MHTLKLDAFGDDVTVTARKVIAVTSWRVIYEDVNGYTREEPIECFTPEELDRIRGLVD